MALANVTRALQSCELIINDSEHTPHCSDMCAFLTLFKNTFGRHSKRIINNIYLILYLIFTAKVKRIFLNQVALLSSTSEINYTLLGKNRLPSTARTFSSFTDVVGMWCPCTTRPMCHLHISFSHKRVRMSAHAAIAHRKSAAVKSGDREGQTMHFARPIHAPGTVAPR
jgi:hypothetical protein